MIRTTIGDLLAGKLDLALVEAENPELYIVRDGALVFYVGKSSTPVDRLLTHFGDGNWNWGRGTSDLGKLVKDNLPDSKSWQVELLSVADCELAIQLQFPKNKGRHMDIAELALIRILNPCLNVMHNIKPTPLPAKYLRRSPSLTDAPCDHLGLRLG